MLGLLSFPVGAKIDVLCLYSEEVRVKWGNLTSVQMESRIMTYFVEANEGNSNSLIPLTYNLFVRPVSESRAVCVLTRAELYVARPLAPRAGGAIENKPEHGSKAQHTQY